MTEAVGTCLICDNLLEFLKTLPWCKQEGDILVAVHTCTPELIVAFTDHEARVFPGGTKIKINKSWLAYLQEKNGEGTPLPILLVWRSHGIELWYRQHKSWDFPYDMWKNPVAQAYEREQVLLPASHVSHKFKQYHQDILQKVKACPANIPPQ
jgi:hypothetical protein